MHHTSGLDVAVEKLAPPDPSNLLIDQIIDDWGTKSEARIAKIRAKLDLRTQSHREISETLDTL